MADCDTQFILRISTLLTILGQILIPATGYAQAVPVWHWAPMVPFRKPAFLLQVEIAIARDSIPAFAVLRHGKCEGRQSLRRKDNLIYMLATPEDDFSRFVVLSVTKMVFCR